MNKRGDCVARRAVQHTPGAEVEPRARQHNDHQTQRADVRNRQPSQGRSQVAGRREPAAAEMSAERTAAKTDRSVPSYRDRPRSSLSR